LPQAVKEVKAVTVVALSARVVMAVPVAPHKQRDSAPQPPEVVWVVMEAQAEPPAPLEVQ
jgi:hypothetical protein